MKTVDTEDRTARYIELDASGEPMHECLHSGPSFGRSIDEEEWFALLVVEAEVNGHTIVRLCNHEARCRNPKLGDIESDGNGGIRAKADKPNALQGVELWKPEMERKFVLARDEREEGLHRVVRMEPGEWTQEMLDEGDFVITKKGIFDWRRRGVPTPEEAVSSAEALLESVAEAVGDMPEEETATFKPPGHGSFA